MAKGLILSGDVKRLTLYSPATRASSSMRNEGRGQARRASCVSWDVPRAGHGACRRAHRSRCARSPAHVSAPLLPPRWARCTHRGTAQLLQRSAGPPPPLRRLDRAERETGPSAQRDAGSVQTDTLTARAAEWAHVPRGPRFARDQTSWSVSPPTRGDAQRSGRGCALPAQRSSASALLSTWTTRPLSSIPQGSLSTYWSRRQLFKEHLGEIDKGLVAFRGFKTLLQWPMEQIRKKKSVNT